MGMDKFGADDICIKVYDPEKKEMIAVYDNYAQAARKLGLTSKVVYAACTNKTRRFSPFLKKEVALRASAKEKS
jgi:hypothetical protein